MLNIMLMNLGLKKLNRRDTGINFRSFIVLVFILMTFDHQQYFLIDYVC